MLSIHITQCNLCSLKLIIRLLSASGLDIFLLLNLILFLLLAAECCAPISGHCEELNERDSLYLLRVREGDSK